MRTERRKQRKLRTGIALLVVFLLAFGGVLIGFGASVDPVVDPPGMRAGGNEPPIGDCVEYKIDSNDLEGVSDGQTIRYFFKDLVIRGEKNVQDTDYVDITFYVTGDGINSFDWQSNIEVGHVFVKGGPGGYLFSYDPPTKGDTNLFCGTGISHITFYICGKEEEPEYKLTVKKVVVDEEMKIISNTETFYFTLDEVAELSTLETVKHQVKVGDDKVFDPFQDGSYVLTEVDLDEEEYELLGYYTGTISGNVGDEVTESPTKEEDDTFLFTFDGADKVITIVNMKPEDEDDPEYKLTVKKIVVDQDRNIIANTETFYFTLEEVAEISVQDTVKYQVKVGEDKVFDPFEDGSYVLTEVDLDEEEYELLGYFEGTIVKAVGEEIDEELDDDDTFLFTFDGADKVITIVNMKLDDEDEPGRGILNVNKVVTGNAPAVNTYAFVVREVVEEGEGWVSEIQQLIPGTTTILDDLEPGDYTIEETQTRGANTVTYSLREFTVAESGTTRITITITNRFPSPGPGPGPSPRPRPTPDPRPEPQEVVDVETITPPFAPPIVEAPVLDQVPAAAPPVLPQTGDVSPLAMILSGLGVSLSGLVFGIRKKEKNSSVTTLFK